MNERNFVEAYQQDQESTEQCLSNNTLTEPMGEKELKSGECSMLIYS